MVGTCGWYLIHNDYVLQWIQIGLIYDTRENKLKIG